MIILKRATGNSQMTQNYLNFTILTFIWVGIAHYHARDNSFQKLIKEKIGFFKIANVNCYLSR